mgnify:CR=1 FL=1
MCSSDLVVRDSIIMNEVEIGDHVELNKAIIAENVVIRDGARLGIGEEVENETDPHIYAHGIVTVGEHSVIPEGITIGKNTVVSGKTVASDYTDATLPSGKSFIKAGETS